MTVRLYFVYRERGRTVLESMVIYHLAATSIITRLNVILTIFDLFCCLAFLLSQKQEQPRKGTRSKDEQFFDVTNLRRDADEGVQWLDVIMPIQNLMSFSRQFHSCHIANLQRHRASFLIYFPARTRCQCKTGRPLSFFLFFLSFFLFSLSFFLSLFLSFFLSFFLSLFLSVVYKTLSFSASVPHVYTISNFIEVTDPQPVFPFRFCLLFCRVENRLQQSPLEVVTTAGLANDLPNFFSIIDTFSHLSDCLAHSFSLDLSYV